MKIYKNMKIYFHKEKFMKRENLTPLEITYLIHIYSVVGKYPFPSPAIEEAKKRFFDQGLIKTIANLDSYDAHRVICTEKGEKLIEMLCKTPFPVQMFLDPREIKKEIQS